MFHAGAILEIIVEGDETARQHVGLEMIEVAEDVVVVVESVNEQ